MKTQDETQRAHDLLLAVLLGELPIQIDDEQALHAMASTTCWILGHEHNAYFAQTLTKLEETAAALGYVATRRTS